MSNERPTNPEQLRPSSAVSAGTTLPASSIPRPPPMPDFPNGEYLQSVVDSAAEKAARRTADYFAEESRIHRNRVEGYLAEHRREALARLRSDEARERRIDIFCEEVRGDLSAIKRRLESGEQRFAKNEDDARADRARAGRVLEDVSALKLLSGRAELGAARPLDERVVLVVEDEPEVSAAMARVLGDAGATVLHAETVEGARLIVAGSALDAVVADVSLRGGEDGMRLVRELRLGHGDIGVVVASGHVDDRLHEEARELDVAAVLCKPYSAAALVRAVAEAVDAARGTQA